MATQLSPEILALLRQFQSGQQNPQMDGFTYQPNYAATGGSGYGESGDGRATHDLGNIQSWDRIGSDVGFGSGHNIAQQFKPDGTYSHDWETGDQYKGIDYAALLMLALGGGGALAQAGAFGGAGLGGGEALGSEALAGGGGLEAGGGLGSFSALPELGAGLEPLATGAVAPLSTAEFGLNAVPAFSGAALQTPWQQLLDPSLAKVAGAALGAATSRDQTQSASKAPWEPAQPFLQSLLDQGQQLQKQYADKPFTDQQQTAYNNLGGLLNTTNSQLGGLLGGFGANASGQNNHDRSNPRRQLTGGAALDLSKFMPGLLNFFPPRG